MSEEEKWTDVPFYEGLTEESVGLAKRIIGEVRRARAQGIAIVRHDWGVDLDREKQKFEVDFKGSPSACPLGAVCLSIVQALPGDEVDTAVARELGVDSPWVSAFVSEIDLDHDPTAYLSLLSQPRLVAYEVMRRTGMYDSLD